MNGFDILFNFIIEPLKYLVMSYGILGFSVRNSKVRYGFLGYILCEIFLVCYCGFYFQYYNILNVFFLLCIVFEGRVTKKIQIGIVEWFMINIIDTFVFSIVVIIMSNILKQDSVIIHYIDNCIGLFIVILLAFLLHKKKMNIYTYFQELTIPYFLVIDALLCCFSINIGLSQGFILEPENFLKKSKRIQEISLVTILITTILCIILTSFFVYNVINRLRLQTESELKEKMLNEQKKYYTELIKKDEGTRRFRHDFKKNIAAMQILAENNQFHELKEYLQTLNQDFQETQMLHSGNAIADYFINSTANEVKQYGDLNIVLIGRFSEKLPISDLDFTILIGNALDNAKEALLQYRGERKLSVTINHNQEHLMIQIVNSSNPKKDYIIQTEKSDVHNHGIGTKNMKQVVEKYTGDISWYYKDYSFTTEIFI